MGQWPWYLFCNTVNFGVEYRVDCCTPNYQLCVSTYNRLITKLYPPIWEGTRSYSYVAGTRSIGLVFLHTPHSPSKAFSYFIMSSIHWTTRRFKTIHTEDGACGGRTIAEFVRSAERSENKCINPDIVCQRCGLGQNKHRQLRIRCRE